MIDFLESTLSEFKKCFSRTATYKWFVIVILGLLTRTDQLGVTSFIRSLGLKEKCYEPLIHFFRSTAYCLNDIKKVWISIVGKYDKLFHLDGRVLLLGDGTKVAKEGKKMPGVQKFYQESENISKSPYIFGHMFGGLAAVIGTVNAYFAVPISMGIHQGLSAIAGWDESLSDRDKSHVVRMIENGYEAAQILGRAILCLDLLWGTGLYYELRFVLVDSKRGKGIFVSTDLSLDPVKIIEGYFIRFSIESTFRESKQQTGTYRYHFWTSCLPKLNRFKKKDEASNLEKVTDEKDKETILATVDATERFVLFSSIAIGLTQMIALDKKLSENISKHRYLRTKSRIKVSEATVLEYMRKNLFRLLMLHPQSKLTKIILEVTKTDSEDESPESGENAA